MLKAGILTIGDELLMGQVIDTNSVWLSDQLNKLGIKTVFKMTVGDTPMEIEWALKNTENLNFLLITGGLGPTKDDITKAVLFKHFKSTPVSDPIALQMIENFVKSRNGEMNKLNINQALVADNCKVLYNSCGTAPGMFFEEKERVVISMPGVPFEMKEMFSNTVIPELKLRHHLSPVLYKTILTTGIAESMLAGLLSDFENQLPSSVNLAYLPSPGIVKLRINLLVETTLENKELFNRLFEQLKLLVRDYSFGYDKDTLEEVLALCLKTSGKTISLAESCTGGHIAASLTKIPGSSEWFKGAVVAYSNHLKTKLLDVSDSDILSFGAVSKQVVESMAKNCRKKLSSDFAIAVSGIAGPSGGSTQKPVGLVWIAVSDNNSVVSKQFLFGENRERNIIKASIAALFFLLERVKKS